MFELVEILMSKEPQKAAARRIYLVSDAGGKERLINASSAAQALTYAYEPLCKVAPQQDIARLCKGGAEVEEAT
jgi:hypothetical protein